MFELPECITLTNQINNSLKGKTIIEGQLGNKFHKFVWYNRNHEEFEKLTRGKKIGKAKTKGKWIFIPIEPDYMLVLGEIGGKLIYHLPDGKIPKTYHLILMFDDNSFLTATTQMWGAMELYEKGKERSRQYIKNMRITPVEPEFTFDYFNRLVEELRLAGKRSVKGLLTQDQLIPGLGNAIVQDILFRSKLHPRHSIEQLNEKQKRQLFDSILYVINEVIEKHGRYDEFDLHNNPGQYVRLMDKKALGNPCPECETAIEKIQYLGGTCYYCPQCQLQSN